MNLFNLVFMVIGLLCIFSVFSLIKVLLNYKKFDELQKKAVYESLAISFFIIAGTHLIQSILSFVTPEPFSTLVKIFISPGPYTAWPYREIITNNSLIHIDSFMFDNIVLGVTYFIKRKKYGLI